MKGAFGQYQQFISEGDKDTMMDACNIEEYKSKMFLTVDELGNLLRISRSMAYKYVQSDACPFYCESIGKRIIIPTKTFFEWYDTLSNNQDKKKGVGQQSGPKHLRG